MKLPFGLNAFNAGLVGLAALTVIVIGAVVYHGIDNADPERITLAAGASTGDSYIISQALKTVVERHYPKLHVTVLETGGTSENLKLLEEKKVQIVTAQADVPAPDSARSIAVLFRDTFQLVVHRGSRIKRFSDLKSKRIALPRRGGQFKSFLAVAFHFGLRDVDFQFVGEDERTADKLFEAGQADAVFRVRALSNNEIVSLSRSGLVEFIPIDHAPAMQIRMPAFIPTVIPEGAYAGQPAMPPLDLPTIGVERTLLTHHDVPDEIIRAITTVLVEFRHEVALAIPDPLAEIRPLLAGVQPPNTQSGLGIAIHPGAKAYYEKDVPTFYQQNADYLGLWVTIILLFGSWIWEGRRLFQRRQQKLADQYNHEVIDLMSRAHDADSVAVLEGVRTELLSVLIKALGELDQGRLSHEAFQSFRTIWQIATDAVRERQTCLPAAAEPALARTARA